MTPLGASVTAALAVGISTLADDDSAYWEERCWQMARVLEVCPTCPITEEGE